MSMQSQFSSAIMQICDEKNISKEAVVEAVQDALAAAYRKDYGSRDQRARAEFDDKTGLFKVYRQFEVVEEVENAEAEKTLEQAKKINSQAEVGDVIEIEVTPKNFGRIAAQTARQVIIQRIREAEREELYKTYKDREGELLFGQVQRVEGPAVFIELEKASVVLERPFQIPGEKFYNGQRIKLYLEKVEKTEKGPNIVISRTHKDFIKGLLELEVPEVAESTVEIKEIAREPGVRTKVAVYSKEEGIDPVGSCVGQKGVRIQAVTNEIGNERIDVVEWDADPVKYLINALSPAKIISIELHEDDRLAKVFVTEDQRSLAIGKNGQNVRLASILTGWEIDIEDFEGPVSEDEEVEASADTDVEVLSPEAGEKQEDEEVKDMSNNGDSDKKDTGEDEQNDKGDLGKLAAKLEEQEKDLGENDQDTAKEERAEEKGDGKQSSEGQKKEGKEEKDKKEFQDKEAKTENEADKKTSATEKSEGKEGKE